MGALNLVERKFFELKGRMGFWKLIRNPGDTPTIFQMNQDLKRGSPPERIAKLMEIAYRDERLEEAFNRQYWPEVPPFEVMERMPEGSFGRAYADFLKLYKLDRDLFPKPNFKSRPDYLLSRVYQAHDFWHVLTGYSSEIKDELALQAFGVGQYRQPISLLIISGGLIHILGKEPERAEEILTSICDGFERGKRAKHLLAEPVLERLMDPLEEVRRDLGLFPRNDGLSL